MRHFTAVDNYIGVGSHVSSAVFNFGAFSALQVEVLPVAADDFFAMRKSYRSKKKRQQKASYGKYISVQSVEGVLSANSG